MRTELLDELTLRRNSGVDVFVEKLIAREPRCRRAFLRRCRTFQVALTDSDTGLARSEVREVLMLDVG